MPQFFMKPSYTKKVTHIEDEIIASIDDNTLFGLVECDIHAPNEHKEKLPEMLPIFKNIEVSRNDSDDYVRDYAERNNDRYPQDACW